MKILVGVNKKAHRGRRITFKHLTQPALFLRTRQIPWKGAHIHELGHDACILTKRARTGRSVAWFLSPCTSQLIKLVFCEPRTGDGSGRSKGDRISINKTLSWTIYRIRSVARRCRFHADSTSRAARFDNFELVAAYQYKPIASIYFSSLLLCL